MDNFCKKTDLIRGNNNKRKRNDDATTEIPITELKMDIPFNAQMNSRQNTGSNSVSNYETIDPSLGLRCIICGYTGHSVSDHLKIPLVEFKCGVCGHGGHSETYHLKRDSNTKRVICDFCSSKEHSSKDHICEKCCLPGHDKNSHCQICDELHDTLYHTFKLPDQRDHSMMQEIKFLVEHISQLSNKINNMELKINRLEKALRDCFDTDKYLNL